jgi:hypothetical protein
VEEKQLDTEELLQLHIQTWLGISESFLASIKVLPSHFIQPYMSELQKEISNLYQTYQARNMFNSEKACKEILQQLLEEWIEEIKEVQFHNRVQNRL